ncbi:hypothetical protein [Hydrogenobacter thermophilus]|uniref:LolA family protein n=1 Tax=Hydrogenobacter thermophilus TaxID=940 RepID=UPI0026EE14E6|nr:hypothetical protein [Hydrogenobacter thermophilus]
MRCFLLLLFISYISFANPLDDAIQKFEKEYRSYSYVMKVNDGMVLRYYYATPGYVRMDIIEPYKGVTLVYDPNIDKVFVRPFKSMKNLILKLSPDNPIVKSSKGHRMDESDVLTLLRTVKELEGNGKMLTEDRGSSYYIDVRGRGGVAVRKVITRFTLLLDKESLFPRYAASYNREGQLIEEVFFEDILINTGFSKDIFILR